MKTSFKFCRHHVRGTSLQTTSGRRARDLVQGQVFARHATQWPGSPGSCVACLAPLALVVMTSRGREDVRAKLRSLPIVKAPVAFVRPVTLVGPSVREALQLHFVAARDVLQNWRSVRGHCQAKLILQLVHNLRFQVLSWLCHHRWHRWLGSAPVSSLPVQHLPWQGGRAAGGTLSEVGAVATDVLPSCRCLQLPAHEPHHQWGIPRCKFQGPSSALVLVAKGVLHLIRNLPQLVKEKLNAFCMCKAACCQICCN